MNPAIIGDIHARAHLNLAALLAHGAGLPPADLEHSLAGFGYPTIRLQLHHAITAERYWRGVLEGVIDAEDDDPDYPTITSLEDLRCNVAAGTAAYLQTTTADALCTPRPMLIWDGTEKILVPLHVIMRTITHLYHHQGQVTAMYRLLGRPCDGFDYPHEEQPAG